MNKKYGKNRRNHDIKVAVWGIIGALCLFGFSILLAMLGPWIEQKTAKKEESSMGIIEDTNLDDIREDLEELAIEINGKQYILVDSVMDILQDYTEED